MYIARWLLTTHNGHKDAAIELLRKWETDVGERIGWRVGSVRVTSGSIGVSRSQLEFEVRVDSLSDLEGAWADMAKNPYHQQYSKELDAHITSSTWNVLEVVELSPAG